MLRVSCLRVVSPAACRRVWSVGLVAVCPRDNPVSCALHRGPARYPGMRVGGERGRLCIDSAG
jgi:hypothetical protein